MYFFLYEQIFIQIQKIEKENCPKVTVRIYLYLENVKLYGAVIFTYFRGGGRERGGWRMNTKFGYHFFTELLRSLLKYVQDFCCILMETSLLSKMIV